MYRLCALLMLLAPLSGFASTTYTYTGNPMSCNAASCPSSSDVYWATFSLELSAPLADGAYYNAVLSAVATGTELADSSILSWSMTDHQGHNFTSADSSLALSLGISSGLPTTWLVATTSGTSSNTGIVLSNDLAIMPFGVGDQSNWSVGSEHWGMETETLGTWTAGSSPADVPEPATLAVSGLALGALAFFRRRA